MIDLPTNGSYIIETQPPPDVYATIRVAGPPPGRSWRVTIAANCSFIEGPWARGNLPILSNVVSRPERVSGFSGTTAADSPGSFQAIVRSSTQNFTDKTLLFFYLILRYFQ